MFRSFANATGNPVLEADYSVALQLLLRYPAPEPPHGPHTFVDDAIYLKGHLNPAGGSALILKYTGRAPTSAPPPPAIADPRPSTPSSLALNLRQRTLGARSPLSTPAKFLQTPGGVEALFQGAAKGVMERGEKLGINQAVRDAVGEIRRNVQGFQEARTPGRSTPRDPFVDGMQRQPSFTVALLERRDRQLAAMLDETIANLRDMAAAKLEGDDRDRYVQAMEVAAAKLQFVKVHLEDASLGLPEDEEMPAINALSLSSPRENRRPTVALDTTPVVVTSSAVETARSTLSSPDSAGQEPTPLPVVQELSAPEPRPDNNLDKMDTDIPQPQPNPSTTPDTASPAAQPLPVLPSATLPHPKRPSAVPTRSTIAQSSFSWMLEPDGTQPSAPPLPHYPHPSNNPSPHHHHADGTQGQGQHKKRPSSSGRRNGKNAFLFGEVVSSSESEGEGGVGMGVGRGIVRTGPEIFGLKTMGK